MVILFHLSTIRKGCAQLNELVFRYGLNDGFVLKKNFVFLAAYKNKGFGSGYDMVFNFRRLLWRI